MEIILNPVLATAIFLAILVSTPLVSSGREYVRDMVRLRG